MGYWWDEGVSQFLSSLVKSKLSKRINKRRLFQMQSFEVCLKDDGCRNKKLNLSFNAYLGSSRENTDVYYFPVKQAWGYVRHCCLHPGSRFLANLFCLFLLLCLFLPPFCRGGVTTCMDYLFAVAVETCECAAVCVLRCVCA